MVNPLVALAEETVRESPSASVSLPITLIETDVFLFVITSSMFATGCVFTVTFTVEFAVAPRPSEIVYKIVSKPVKFMGGV